MASLTRAEASSRARLVTVESYAVDLDLTVGDQLFESTTTIRFRCSQPGQDTFVELRPAQLYSATLNGRPLDPARLVDNRLVLRGLTGRNELVVRAGMRYSNSGEGLHRFVDPADGAVYVYAHTFLDNAQRVFACFDQPDLKAPFTLTVTAPPEWTVLSNSTGRRTPVGQWVFARTAPLPTYLVTLAAGRIHSRRIVHDGVPLGLHCRAALAEYLDRDADELLTVTRQCLDRYHELFGMRYPFGKYDQVFVPEFNAGAMENAGCVMFRDEMVFRSAVTEADREVRAVVVAHEMAHMWFGDLVTMRWWDDLWLNESFAEYLGHRVTVEATRFTGAWTTFAVHRKAWGYAADQRPSTHSVAPTDVGDTAEALLNFDGISYAKGAAVLRQLVAWLGDDRFLAGLRAYFAAHAYGNASLDDLLAALATASGRDLNGWARVWLRQPQVNTLRPVVAEGPDGRYTRVTIVQNAPLEHFVLRPHRLAVGVYDRDADGAIVRHQRVEVELEPAADGGATSIAALVGTPAARLLLVNDDDLTYAKIRLSDSTLADLPRLLPAIADPLARALVWSAAWDAARDGEWPARSFVTLAATALPEESQPGVFAEMLHVARTAAVPRYLPERRRDVAMARLVTACGRTLAQAPAGSGRQLAAARGFARCAGHAEVGLLHGWLTGQGVPDGLVMDAELRWVVLQRLAVLGAVGTTDIETELDRDRSAHGAEHAAWCRAALPDAVGKADAWNTVIGDDRLSNRTLLATARGFWQAEQGELTEAYVERYFIEMPAVAARRPPQVLLALAHAAYPQYAVSPQTLVHAEHMLARPDLAPGLRRAAVDRTDDLRRALAAQAAADA